MKDALDALFGVSILIKYSPRRDSTLENLKKAMASETIGFRVLCPTRWTIRANSLRSVLRNYSVLQELWEVSKGHTNDPPLETELLVLSLNWRPSLTLIVYPWGSSFWHTYNLSKKLQCPTVSAGGESVPKMTVATLQTLRDEHFDQFWEWLMNAKEEVDGDEPELSQLWKQPRHRIIPEVPLARKLVTLF